MSNRAIPPTAPKRYANLMTVVKARLIECRNVLEGEVKIFELERIGIHLRKLTEAVAHSCLIACEMRTGVVPRQIQNSSNAADTIKFLQHRNILHFPKCARIGFDPDLGVRTIDVFEPAEDLVQWLLELYQQSHNFAHEPNPYAQWQYYSGLSSDYLKEQQEIARTYHREVWNWLWQHVVQVGDNWYLADFGAADSSPVAIVEISKPPEPVGDSNIERIGLGYRES